MYYNKKGTLRQLSLLFTDHIPRSQNCMKMQFCETCKRQNALKMHFVCIAKRVTVNEVKSNQLSMSFLLVDLGDMSYDKRKDSGKELFLPFYGRDSRKKTTAKEREVKNGSSTY